MSDRLLKILAAGLVLVALAWAVARFVSGRGGGPETGSFDFAAAVALELDSIVVASADDTVRLRAGEPWTVNGYESLPETGVTLERALEEARVGQLVGRNPENHERMGVTQDKGRRLSVFAGGTERVSIIIGERARTFDQAYARRVGADEVYLLSGTLVNLTNRSADDWRSREIFSAEREIVQRIELAYPDESFAVVRDSAGWRIEPSGVEADAGKVSSLLGQLTGLRAIGFAADSVSEELDWVPPAARVRVVGPDDTELGKILFLENEDVGYFARRAGSPIVYTVSSYVGDQILVREADLAAQ